MSLVRKIFAIHSNPVNLVGVLVMLYGLITWSLSQAATGALMWAIGFVFQKRFPRKGA
jgi:hypothetical protein